MATPEGFYRLALPDIADDVLVEGFEHLHALVDPFVVYMGRLPVDVVMVVSRKVKTGSHVIIVMIVGSPVT